MKMEAVTAGFYESATWGRKYPKMFLPQPPYHPACVSAPGGVFAKDNFPQHATEHPLILTDMHPFEW